MNGISYYASNQWQVAAKNPPHLAACCIWEGSSDIYREQSRHGGILCTFRQHWYDMQVKTVQHGLGERGRRSPITGDLVCGPETLTDEELAENRIDIGQAHYEHQLIDEFYSKRQADFSKITVPLMSAGNWGGHGLHLRGNVEGFLQIASEHKWLELHGLEHWTEFYTDYGIDLQKRFLAHFLKGEETAWKDEPRVRLQVRYLDKFVERSENEWPLARTQWTKFHLDLNARALSRKPVPDATFTYDALGEGVTFLSEPLSEETEIDRADGAEIVLVVVDERYRRLCGAPRVLAKRRRSSLPRRNRSAYAACARLAARLASKARRRAQYAVSSVAPARRLAPVARRRDCRSRRRNLADVHCFAAGLSHRTNVARQGL